MRARPLETAAGQGSTALKRPGAKMQGTPLAIYRSQKAAIHLCDPHRRAFEGPVSQWGIPHHDSGAVPQTTAVSTDQGITRDGSMRLDGRRRLGWH